MGALKGIRLVISLNRVLRNDYKLRLFQPTMFGNGRKNKSYFQEQESVGIAQLCKLPAGIDEKDNGASVGSQQLQPEPERGRTVWKEVRA